jgi:hypothetical protein
MLGVSSMDVAALAAAEVFSGGSSDQCVLPFAIIDLWDENDPGEDPNGNDVPDEGEEWFLQDDPEGTSPDPYFPFADPEIAAQYGTYAGSGGTGLGSGFRDGKGADPVVGDLGRRIVIKTAPGHGGPAPGGSDGGGWRVGRGGDDESSNQGRCHSQPFAGLPGE